jgi:hypothetical protein
MHSHENPNRQVREINPCIAALQILTGSSGELAALASSGALEGMLYLFCSK